jgi:hypothetical protein
MKSSSEAMVRHVRQERTSLAMCVKLILVKHQPRILRIYNSNPGLVQTLWPHGYVDGEVVKIMGVRGMTELNFREFAILKVSDYFFQINEDSTSFNFYQGKGEARRVIGFTNFNRNLEIGL